MRKRTVIFGDYDTAQHGWTLTAYSLAAAEQKLDYVEKVGADGSWDMSTVLTDGIPRYKDRPFSATFECSEGTRNDRSALISEMVNLLDGFVWPIIPPDHPDHYLIGRLQVTEDLNSLAYAQVTVSAVCEPWLYFSQMKHISLIATEELQSVQLPNAGRLAVVPELIVVGNVDLLFGNATFSLITGSHEWPDLLLMPGTNLLQYRGDGSVMLSYREAVLR